MSRSDRSEDTYGKELILDLHDCNIRMFNNRRRVKAYFIELCKLIDMEREDLHFWDYEGDPVGYKEAPPHLKGISAVQFIKTSSVVVHTLEDLRKVFINVFSCKDFNHAEVRKFTEKWFGGRVVNENGEGLFIDRM